jgi:hypothetical protein
MNVSRLVSLLDRKIAPDIKFHNYHVLLTQMIIVGIQNILSINVLEAIMNFCFFFNAIGKKSTKSKSSWVIWKNHYETLCVLEMYFPPTIFDISIHFTAHLIKEIKLLGPMCQYPTDRVPLPTSSKSWRRARRVLTHAHVSMTSGYATRHKQLGCCHTSHDVSSRLLARGSSGAATCPVLPSPGSGQLGCCHASRGTSSCLLT